MLSRSIRQLLIKVSCFLDGNIILWRPTESKEAVSRFAESDDEEFERETWRVQSMMRGSLSDIYDLAWSPDGRYIISGSIDNTARIWDVRDGIMTAVFTPGTGTFSFARTNGDILDFLL